MSGLNPKPQGLSHRFSLLVLLISLILTACSFNTTDPLPLAVGLPTSTIPPTLLPPAAPTSAILPDRPHAPALADLFDQVQTDRLMLAVSTLADMKTRHVISAQDSATEGIGAARNWLRTQFQGIRDAAPSASISVWTQPIAYAWKGVNIKSDNVVAILPGLNVGAGVYVVGAHYDSIGSDFTNGKAPAPGANENGSGVAILLEIARIMANRPHRATIVLVAFTGEETGRQGSIAFIKNYLQAQNPPIAIRGMINLDLLGSEQGVNGQVDKRTMRLFSAEPNDSISRQFARQITLLTNTYMEDVNLVIQSAEERQGHWGDQQSFSAAGYASVRLIQGLEDQSRQDTPRDTIDGIQSSYLTRAAHVALLATYMLSNGPTPPTNLNLRAKGGDPTNDTLIWAPSTGAVGYVIALRQNSSLFFDQVITVGNVTQLTGDSFTKYTNIAIAGYNSAGEIGPLSQEIPIASLLGK